jgi:uncharacterized repeat protein (TIGR01451 family)
VEVVLKRRRRAATGALAVGAALGVATSADAATFTVTTNADSGAGSLRQAIADANGLAGADTITFNAALSGSTIALTTGQIAISDSVDIQGLGSANLTVNAGAASRVFYVYNPALPATDVTISGLTLTNGRVTPDDPSVTVGGAIAVIGENLSLQDVAITNSEVAGDGGGLAFLAIDNTSDYNPVVANLTIEDSRIAENASNIVELPLIDQGGCGGGIWVGAATSILVDNTQITGNTARCDGGGFFATYLADGAEVTIQSSVISGNQAGAGTSTYGNGGGLAFLYMFGYSTIEIVDSTISGNSTDGFAGGIAAGYMYDGLTIRRSTISGNEATEEGGGIEVGYILTDNVIENSTIANNNAYAYGGGIYTYYAGVVLKETTVSGNSAAVGAGFYAYGESRQTIHDSIVANNGSEDLADDGSVVFDLTYSLIENTGTADIDDLGGNLLGVDPQLGPLQNNGGPTETMRPAAASPVVNAGDPAFAPPPATDQRGFSRVSGGRIDMGAVELNAGTIQFALPTSNVNENAGPAVITVTRTGGTDGAVSAQVTLVSSTATGGGVDFTFAGAPVNFPDGSAVSQVVNVAITDDPSIEPSETVTLGLGSLVGATAGVPSSHVLTIVDNDVAASANLTIVKSIGAGPTMQGGTVTFTLTVTNAGPDAAPGVVVSDTLPAQLTLISATPSAGSCSGNPAIVCNVGTINNGGSATVTILATMTGTGSTTNIATVSSGAIDSAPAGNTSQVTFTIAPAELVAVPALDPRLQVLLAAILGAVAVGALTKRG